MRYILAPEWSHLGLATAAAFVLGWLICWAMDRLFLKRLVDDRIAGIALSCGLAFVLIMAVASVALTWFVRSQPYIAGRPIVVPPLPYALSLILGLAAVGVIRTILYGRDYEAGDGELVFDPDIHDLAQYDEEVIAWDERNRNRNYFQRHWAGHLSLPVSYWVNGAILSALILAAVEYLAGRMAEGGGSLRGIAIVALAYLGVSAILWVWSSVGICRSAYWHHRRGGTHGWGLAARTAVVLSLIVTLFRSGDLALQATELGTLARGRDSIGEVARMTVSGDGRQLLVDGNLAAGAAERFEALLDRSPAVREVVLSSPGGRMLEAERMAALIRDRNLDSRVAGQCMSACTSLLLAGRIRTAPESARIGFHQPSFPGVSAYALGDAIDRTRAEYLAAGVEERFVGRALATPAQSMWFPTPEELVEAKVLTGSDRFVAGAGGGRRRETLVEMRLRRQMEAAARRINARGPVRLDALTTLEGASASGPTLTQHYRVKTEGVDIAGSRAGLERSFRQEICSDAESALTVREGGRFVLSYKDERGRAVFDVVVGKCG
ncbi:MAG TPA: hypothetical protein VE891_14305 [Allosphingosinicella sp.]|nr:hypothetical protein [Allosphingosinicella sp.]